jgi:hypothetical protein
VMCYTPDSLPDGFEVYRIKPTIQAVRIGEAFEVKQRDGKTHMCRDGWLVKNSQGEIYAVPDSVFEAVYERV